MNWKINLMNFLLDTHIDEYGLYETIHILLLIGIDFEQLLELGFDREDIRKVFETYFRKD